MASALQDAAQNFTDWDGSAAPFGGNVSVLISNPASWILRFAAYVARDYPEALPALQEVETHLEPDGQIRLVWPVLWRDHREERWDNTAGDWIY